MPKEATFSRLGTIKGFGTELAGKERGFGEEHFNGTGGVVNGERRGFSDWNGVRRKEDHNIINRVMD
jgi:hypothetical protein